MGKCALRSLLLKFDGQKDCQSGTTSHPFPILSHITWTRCPVLPYEVPFVLSSSIQSMLVVCVK